MFYNIFNIRNPLIQLYVHYLFYKSFTVLTTLFYTAVPGMGYFDVLGLPCCGHFAGADDKDH